MIAGEHRLALPAGFQLGKYRFQGVLGAGGFGITYLAEDSSLGRRVAIKELLPNDIATRIDGSTVVAKTKGEEENLAWARDRFVREGRALAACEHPSVVHVYEMVEANGTAYMVTRYEEGRSFSEWLKELDGPPREKELRAILTPLLAGLEKVHRSGFLHRDIKPENIYLTDDGRPILLDFGSARQAISDRTTSLTSIVTSGYAPFEQYHEDGKQGAWTDIYALGAVMYRAIHGQKPPEATRRLRDDPCVRLGKLYSERYSGRFLHSVDNALQFEPHRRPQSVAQWREQLGTAPLEVPAPGPSWEKICRERWQQFLKFAQEKPAWVGGGAGAAGLAVLLLALALRPSHSRPEPPPIAVATPVPVATPAAAVATPPPVVHAVPPPAHPAATPVPPPAVNPAPNGVWSAFENLQPAGPGPRPGQKWQNSLGTIFAPVPGAGVHMGVNAVRVEEFEAFVRATGYTATAGVVTPTAKGPRTLGNSWANPGFPQSAQNPAVGLSAYDALAFCQWLTGQERAAGTIGPRFAYRLPTDDEWSAAVGRAPFSWGDIWPPPTGAGNFGGEELRPFGFSSQLNGYRDAYPGTAPVGTFRANAAGFNDLSGNALSWTSTWYRRDLNSAEIRDRIPQLNEDGGGHRFLVLRGSSWATSRPEMLRADFRDFALPEVRTLSLGFRCVLAPESEVTRLELPPLAGPEEPSPGPAPAGGAVEKKLVGTWEHKPAGATAKAIRWEQDADGYFTMSDGEGEETGATTAANGHLQQIADGTGRRTDATYQFRGVQLVTTGPLGETVWRRVSSTTTRSREAAQAARNSTPDNDDDRSETHRSVPERGRSIMGTIRRHFGF